MLCVIKDIERRGYHGQKDRSGWFRIIIYKIYNNNKHIERRQLVKLSSQELGQKCESLDRTAI